MNCNSYHFASDASCATSCLKFVNRVAVGITLRGVHAGAVKFVATHRSHLIANARCPANSVSLGVCT